MLDALSELRYEKSVNAAENAFVERALLLDENLFVAEQNNERQAQPFIGSMVVGKTELIS